jgi:carbamoyl-phosphate synthase / aspartate carbamoyltransferase / dihydroorotase
MSGSATNYDNYGHIQLDNGISLEGTKIGFWDDSECVGEVVFQTGMVGYIESLTDPSYRDQILVVTYPLIGNYGVPHNVKDGNGISRNFESDQIQVKAFIIGQYDNIYSHWNARTSLNDWLIENKIPGLANVDTRKLVKIIRENGTLIGKLTNTVDYNKKIIYHPKHLVQDVVEDTKIKIINENGYPRVLVVNCGIKNNQLRILEKTGASLKIVPWNYNFQNENFDRLLISNGPGDPKDCNILIERLRTFLEYDNGKTPIMGICLGHQILALAIGSDCYKMKYGNRGHNIPCLLKINNSKRAYITAQNHGYAVDTDKLPTDWKELFVNLNDGSNEGIYHTSKPYFSVQFHPEAKSGPEDTSFLFDLFLSGINVSDYAATFDEPVIERKKRKKVLLLGSGGLKIGQSGEFDYSGSQAIKAFKEEGSHVVVINPNIATVQTSPDFVDKVYFLPINLEYVTKVIKLERPDCLSLSFGGQTALNCGIELYRSGILEKYDIEVLGTTVETIITSEDRQLFKNHVESVGEQVPPSCVVESIDDGISFAHTTNYPILVRAAFALGGLGSGFANTEEELVELLKVAFAYSHQVILDQSLKGWKELEFEVVRDVYDNCITTCSMENIDPLGVHTGESIVVAPSQTLTDQEHNMLRSTALKVVRSLGIVGECNIQFALDPKSLKYYIIELNPRLSRSSALASKATGYPLAYIGAKLSLGFSLTEIKNSITQTTTACFEPSLDYCVVKVPRWDLKKFPLVDRRIGTAMKSVGEAMAIGRDFNEAFQKALRMANESIEGFEPNICPYNENSMCEPRDDRMLSIATGLYQNVSPGEIHKLTGIDLWFILKFQKIVATIKELENSKELTKNLLTVAKREGFSDRGIAKYIKSTELVIRSLRKKYQINPVAKQIDTVAGEFPCYTNYLYLTYNGEESDLEIVETDQSVIVLGSGVYKIGSSVEFDWCAVSSIRELKKLGEKITMINCNPETVSTDYDEADRLYFDELSFETVMDIYEMDNPKGIILSMGGQLPNNIAMPLYRQGVKVIGTSPEMVDHAENRYKFSRLLDNIQVDQPVWKELTSMDEAILFCNEVEYPCLVRPSYVLSGVAMNVAYSDKDLIKYLNTAVAVSRDYPVVISKFIVDAKEIEVDAVSENGIVKYIAISEHVENAGVHSGDATLILPPIDLTDETVAKIKKSTYKISRSLNINGPFNIQFIAKDDQVKVIECNLRVSRSFPFVSKTLGVNFIKEATRIMMGISTEQAKYSNRIGVKVAQFSFNRLKDADINLGVEMLSTGEVACFGSNHYEAFIKAIQAAGIDLPKKKILFSVGSYKFKQELKPYMRTLNKLGYELCGTQGTSEYYAEHGITIKELSMNNIYLELENKNIDLCCIISKKNKIRSQADGQTDGYLIRRKAVESGISVVTDIKFAKLMINSLEYLIQIGGELEVKTEIDSLTAYRRVRLPGLIDVHVHVREPGATHKEDWTSCTKAAISGGITTIFAMPNTEPAIVDQSSLELVKKIAQEKSLCDWGIILGASSNNFNSICELGDQSTGLKLYLNNTFGSLKLESMTDWSNHIKAWNDTLSPICVHAEGKTLGAVLHLAALHNKRIHVCHVATKEEIELIRVSKSMGMNVTCEVTPHHLFLTTEDLKRLGPFGHVKPDLAHNSDQDALWANMDIIDCFATDHAPHSIHEKQSCGCPGFPGLETALPLLLTAVKEGRLTLEDIILRYHTNPKKIFHIETDPNTYIEVDLDKEWTIHDTTKYSKAGWTPFASHRVYGRVTRVVIRGKNVFIDGKFLIEAGYGKNVRETVSTVCDLVHTIDKQFDTELKKMIDIKLDHVHSVEQFNRNTLRTLFHRASELRILTKEKGCTDILKNKVWGSLFYEPSTRTRCSFSAAIKRLGGDVIEISAADASIQKGESIEDTVRCLESYCDGIIIRSNNFGDIQKAISVAKKPIVSAGDGIGEHPTQALLDVYTIREERGTVNGINIAIIGDLKNGRTVHSLVKLLTNYKVRIRYIHPPGLEIPKDVWDYVQKHGIEQSVHSTLDEILERTDILYVTRIQKERFSSIKEYEKVKGSYIITPRTLTKAKPDLIIMHPLPRVDEISTELDNDPRSAYFRQMEYGLYIRMALLEIMNKN